VAESTPCAPSAVRTAPPTPAEALGLLTTAGRQRSRRLQPSIKSRVVATAWCSVPSEKLGLRWQRSGRSCRSCALGRAAEALALGPAVAALRAAVHESHSAAAAAASFRAASNAAGVGDPRTAGARSGLRLRAAGDIGRPGSPSPAARRSPRKRRSSAVWPAGGGRAACRWAGAPRLPSPAPLARGGAGGFTPGR
jgi:hypothetical protein